MQQTQSLSIFGIQTEIRIMNDLHSSYTTRMACAVGCVITKPELDMSRIFTNRLMLIYALLLWVLLTQSAIAQTDQIGRITNREEVRLAIDAKGIPKSIDAIAEEDRHSIQIEYDEFKDSTSIRSEFIRNGLLGSCNITLRHSFLGKSGPPTGSDQTIGFFARVVLGHQRESDATKIFWIVDGLRFETMPYNSSGVYHISNSGTNFSHQCLFNMGPLIAEFIARSDSARLRYVGSEYELTELDKATLLEMVRLVRPQQAANATGRDIKQSEDVSDHNMSQRPYADLLPQSKRLLVDRARHIIRTPDGQLWDGWGEFEYRRIYANTLRKNATTTTRTRRVRTSANTYTDVPVSTTSTNSWEIIRSDDARAWGIKTTTFRASDAGNQYPPLWRPLLASEESGSAPSVAYADEIVRLPYFRDKDIYHFSITKIVSPTSVIVGDGIAVQLPDDRRIATRDNASYLHGKFVLWNSGESEIWQYLPYNEVATVTAQELYEAITAGKAHLYEWSYRIVGRNILWEKSKIKLEYRSN